MAFRHTRSGSGTAERGSYPASPAAPFAFSRAGLIAFAAALVLLFALLPAGAARAASLPAGVGTAKTAASDKAPKPTDGGEVPKPDAGAWLIGDLNSGEVFADSGEGKQLAPASTIKLLTAISLYPHLDVHASYTARDDDASIDGTRVGMVPGAKYTIDQLFHALIMSSANDAAHALGNAVGGEDKAVALMKEKAFDLGLTGTTIKDTSGLNDTTQTMTVADMMIVAHAVVKVPYLMKLASTLQYDFPGSKVDGVKKKGFPIYNHTQLVGEYDGALGLKNGYTIKAGGSYVAVAERGGRRLVATILKAKGDTRTMAIALLDWGFAQKAPAPVARVSFEGRVFSAPSQEDPTAPPIATAGASPGGTASPGSAASPGSPGAAEGSAAPGGATVAAGGDPNADVVRGGAGAMSPQRWITAVRADPRLWLAGLLGLAVIAALILLTRRKRRAH